MRLHDAFAVARDEIRQAVLVVLGLADLVAAVGGAGVLELRGVSCRVLLPVLGLAAFAALAVLVLGYPCALGMATPLALIRGGGMAANRGILMRSGDAFQISQNVDHILLDKTGTITVGEPTVSELVTVMGGHDNVPRMAAAAETVSEHPLAEAILDYADKQNVGFPDPEDFESITGKDVRATVQGGEVLVGKPGWLRETGVDLSDAEADLKRLQGRGLTVSGAVVDGKLVGLVGIGDEIKDDAAETVQWMKDEGITPVMIMGDNERTVHAVAAATTGMVHSVFAMIAIILSVSVVLANSFAGQLISGEGITTEFSAETATVP